VSEPHRPGIGEDSHCVRKTATLDEALEWGRKLARATTLPIEVRPFQGELED
jgi:hypothetical protein